MLEACRPRNKYARLWPQASEGDSLTDAVLALRDDEGGSDEAPSSPTPEPERPTDDSSFKQLLRMPPYDEDFPDAFDLRAELPRADELGLGE
jgi:hypothetical protein